MSTPSLEVLLGELLRKQGLRLAIAESCTGGLIGHRITNVPGSSDYYLGSITAYANEAKVRLLGVRCETIDRHGAVSQEIVLEMCKGVRSVLNADIGLAITGIAGPGGGTPDKPVGLTWIAISTSSFQQAWQYTWQGDRLAVKQQSAEKSLALLKEHLQQTNKRQNAEQVEVTVKFDLCGDLLPLKFIWNENLHEIPAVGRHWEDALGKHFLVMNLKDQVFELLFIPVENRWYLMNVVKNLPAA